MAGSYDSSVIIDSRRGVLRQDNVATAPRGHGPSTERAPHRTPSATPDAQQTNDGESTRTAVDKLRDIVRVVQRDLRFSVDEGSGRTVVTVLDSNSGEVIRQIPSEQLLQVAENLDEINGILFRGSA